MDPLSLVVVSTSHRFDAVLESSDRVALRARVDDFEQLGKVVAESCPDLLVVSLHQDPEAVFQALGKLLAPRPSLIFQGPDDSSLILRAMRSGAREYIAPAPDEEAQLLAAIEQVARQSQGSTKTEAAPLLALLGAKGGVGTSFTACQLAAELARLGGSTALVDGQLRHGDLALYLDLSPLYTLASLATRSEPIDSAYLRAALAPHASGVQVLAAPKRPEEAEAVSVKCVEEVAGLLRSEFDWVIWDMPSDFEDRSLFILDQATSILLITTPDVPALNHTRMQLELLERLGHSEAEIRVVLNRSEAGASVSGRDAKSFLQRSVDAKIPNDFKRASACVDEGRTLHEVAPRSSLAQSMEELAGLVHTWSNRPSPSPPRRGLLDRLIGK